MKLLKRISIVFLLLIALVLIGALIYTRLLAKSALPDYNQDIAIAGLEEPVQVYRDAQAIPHIYAQNQHDLYMATGYVMAQDRMWQMDLLRRVTLGRLSEIFGADYLDTDLLLRSLRFTEKSEQILQTTDRDVKESVKAFTAGVNAYIEDHATDYPFEFKLLGYKPDPWEEAHSLNLIGYMAWSLKAGWSELILEQIAAKVDRARFAELLPELDLQKTYVFGTQNNDLLAANQLLQLSRLESMGLDIFSGSNNWAVSGEKSATGLPLLANDMHLGYGIPGIWMQVHQVIEGELNASGLALPGQPLLVVGHNDSVAWGMTNTYVDNLDFYEEKINPEDSNQYSFNGEWKNFEIREEIILDKEGNEHKMTYRLNHRGPVISGIKNISDRVLTMRWVGDEPSDEFRSIYLVNRAHNWEDFKNAFKTFRSISQNIAYADRQGNIGIYACAGIPVRERDSIYAVLPGSTDKYDWKGLVPFEELPFEFNPERGYVSSANNRTVDDSYPYHIGIWYAKPYRIDRIREMLEEKEKFTVEDFKAIQNDFTSKYAELFLSNMLPLLPDTMELDGNEIQAYKLLKAWDYTMHKESIAASIFQWWSDELLVTFYRDELGEELFKKFLDESSIVSAAQYAMIRNMKSEWTDDISTPETESFENRVYTGFKAALDTLKAMKGNDMENWTWGSMHTLTLEHPLASVEALDKVFKLNRGPYGLEGSHHTISQYKNPPLQPDKVYHGVSQRNIYDLNNWDNSVSVIPTGNSGIPASEFYCNQSEMYVAGEYHPDFYSKAKVEENAKFSMQFIP